MTNSCIEQVQIVPWKLVASHVLKCDSIVSNIISKIVLENKSDSKKILNNSIAEFVNFVHAYKRLV